MKGDLVRYLEMRLADSTGRDVKWLLLMAEIKVDLTGMKDTALKYWESLPLVMSWRRMPFSWFGWDRFCDC